MQAIRVGNSSGTEITTCQFQLVTKNWTTKSAMLVPKKIQSRIACIRITAPWLPSFTAWVPFSLLQAVDQTHSFAADIHLQNFLPPAHWSFPCSPISAHSHHCCLPHLHLPTPQRVVHLQPSSACRCTLAFCYLRQCFHYSTSPPDPGFGSQQQH